MKKLFTLRNKGGALVDLRQGESLIDIATRQVCICVAKLINADKGAQ